MSSPPVVDIHLTGAIAFQTAYRPPSGDFETLQLERIVAQLDAASARKTPVVLLHIDSPGGEVAAGFCLYTALRAFAAGGGLVVAHVRFAGSTAALLALAADVVVVDLAGEVGMHGMFVTGGLGLEEVRDKYDQDFGSLVRSRSAIPAAELATWLGRRATLEDPGGELLTAQRALELGYADLVGDAALARELAGRLSQGERVTSRRGAALAARAAPDPAEELGHLALVATQWMTLSRAAAGAHGFFNRTANRVRQTVHPAMVEWGNAEGWWDKTKTIPTFATTGVMVMGIFTVTQILGSLLEGRGPEEGEELPEWLKRKYASAPLTLAPIVGGDLSQWVETKIAADAVRGRVASNPSGRAPPVVASLMRLFENVAAVTDDEREDSARFWAAYEVAALAAGLPVSQPKRTVPYLLDVAGGGERDFEWLPVIYGQREGMPGNIGTVLQDLEEP